MHTQIASPVGPLTLVAEDGALVGLIMDGGPRARRPRQEVGVAVEAAAECVVASAAEQLGEYFAGSRQRFDVPLHPLGEAFEQAVWSLVREIPYGQTRSYGQLAAQLGDRCLAQAVGHANAANPLLLLVPCHRVVGADSSLVGYAGGLDRKRHLLDLEQPAAGSDRLF